MEGAYTTQQVARWVGLSAPEVRALTRAGRGDGEHGAAAGAPLRFGDLAMLRMAGALRAAGMGPARIARALRSLRRQLPASRPLSSTGLRVQGGRVVASDGCAWWEPETGQLLLPLGDAAAAPQPIFIARETVGGAGAATPRVPPELGADAACDAAAALTHVDPTASFAYALRALALAPGHVEARVQLGCLCALAGDGRRALSYFRDAAQRDFGHAVAHLNLAMALHDAAALAEAEEAYRHALLLEPHLAVGHYHLATLLRVRGEHEDAARHRAAYRRLRARQPHGENS